MNFVLYIGHLGRRELSGATGYPDKRRMRLKRIISVLAVMGLMAALLAASAMPAFAKVKQTEGGTECDLNTGLCSGTFGQVGGSKDSEFNGKRTTDFTLNFNEGENFGDLSLSTNDQGGGKDTGGGNCTTTQEGNVFDDPQLSEPTPPEGNGSRCNQQ